MHAAINFPGIAADRWLPCSLYWAHNNEYWCAVPTAIANENNWIYVARLPWGEASLAWQFFELGQFGAIDGVSFVDGRDTLVIDDDGYLKVPDTFDDDPQLGLRAFVDNGYLTPVYLPTPGVWVGDGGGYLVLTTGADITSVTSMAISDTQSRPSMPWLGFDTAQVASAEIDPEFDVCDFKQFDAGNRTRADIEWYVRTRPLFWGSQAARKKAKRLRMLIENTGSSVVTLSVTPIIDGVHMDRRTVTVPVGVAPQEVTLRVGGRGRLIQFEVFSRQRHVRITSITVDAQIMEDRP
jgi:hypothetical protein